MRRPRVPQPLDVARVLAARRGRGLVAVFDVDGTLAPIAPTPADARVPPADAPGAPPPGAPARYAGRHRLRPSDRAGGPAGRTGPLARRPARSGPACARRPRRAPLVRRGGAHRSAAGAKPGGVAARRAGCRHRAEGPRGGGARACGVAGGARPRAQPRRALRARIAGRCSRGGASSSCVRTVCPARATPCSGSPAARPGAAILYAGDDATDEDAFHALRRDDFSILVGAARARRERPRDRSDTAALFTLPDTTAVAQLIELLGAP